MKLRINSLIPVVLIAVLTAFLVLMLTKIVSIIDALPLAISLLALIVSILASFKDELFPFRLLVFSDTLHLVAAKAIPPLTGITVQVLLPITFFNRGYSEVMIQTIRLMVIAENTLMKHEFLPVVEVDMTAFIQQMKGLNASNVLGAFVGFILEAKRSVKKNIVFTPVTKPGSSQFIWRPDVYCFELYIQVYGDKHPKKYFELKQEIGVNVFVPLFSGKTKSLCIYPTMKGLNHP